MTKLFIGSLPYTVTNEALSQLLEPFGKVISATMITDKFTGQSKGFGFVEMEDDAAAQKAIQELNGSQQEGRSIVVAVARPQEERPRRDNFRQDSRGGGGGYGHSDRRPRRDR